MTPSSYTEVGDDRSYLSKRELYETARSEEIKQLQAERYRVSRRIAEVEVELREAVENNRVEEEVMLRTQLSRLQSEEAGILALLSSHAARHE